MSKIAVVKFVIVCFLISRVLLVGGAVFWVAMQHDWLPNTFDSIAEPFIKWDALWYIKVVEEGYYYLPGGVYSTAYYSPLYPEVVRLLTFTGVSTRVAGFLVSNAALLACMVISCILIRRETQSDIAVKTTGLLIALSPFAFYHFSIFTESMFLALTAATFYCASTKKWILAGLFGLLATLTKSIGVFLCLYIFAEFLSHYGIKSLFRRPKLMAQIAFASILPFFGRSLHRFFKIMVLGPDSGYFTEPNPWGRALMTPWESAKASSWLPVHELMMLWFGAILVIASCLLMWRLRMRPGYIAFTFFVGLAAYSSGINEFIGRILSAVLPFYLLGGHLAGRSETFRLGLVIISAFGLGLLLCGYLSYYRV